MVRLLMEANHRCVSTMLKRKDMELEQKVPAANQGWRFTADGGCWNGA